MKGRNEKSRDDICFTPKRVCSHAVDLAPKPPLPPLLLLASSPPTHPPSDGIGTGPPRLLPVIFVFAGTAPPPLPPVGGPSKTWEGGESSGQGDTC